MSYVSPFAVPAVEVAAVPGRQPFGRVALIFLRHIHSTGDLIRLAYTIGAAAFWDRIAQIDNAGTRFGAVSWVDHAGKFVGCATACETRARTREREAQRDPACRWPSTSDPHQIPSAMRPLGGHTMPRHAADASTPKHPKLTIT